MKMCEICHERKAVVPDRNRMGRPIKRICSECHMERLRGDAFRILQIVKRNKEQQPNNQRGE